MRRAFTIRESVSQINIPLFGWEVPAFSIDAFILPARDAWMSFIFIQMHAISATDDEYLGTLSFRRHQPEVAIVGDEFCHRDLCPVVRFLDPDVIHQALH